MLSKHDNIMQKNKLLYKPRVGILVDTPGWAYDTAAQYIQKYLHDDYDISIYYVRRKDIIDPAQLELLHVCFWGESYHQQFDIPAQKIIKEVSSHRWQYEDSYGKLTPEAFCATYLKDACYYAATSKRLQALLAPHLGGVVGHLKNGFDENIFFPPPVPLTGDMRLVWAGNAQDPVKGVNDILRPAARGFRLHLAEGNLSHVELANLYRACDILVVSSAHEAEPLPLIEAMACGCFPVCCDVGIVPEIIKHKENGYIVQQRSVADFREAFGWCRRHLSDIREMRYKIANSIQDRQWKCCVGTYRQVWDKAIHDLYYPVFRNDDVSPDTNLKYFKRFCNIFHDEGFTQIHAVTLSGYCNVLYQYGGIACEYKDKPPISYWKNEEIKKYSSTLLLENNKELVAYLNEIPDELAFHGTAHFDFSQMSDEEQFFEFKLGLQKMKQLFPRKKIRYFIPPFNRLGKNTELIAKNYGLTTLKTEGLHFEEQLDKIKHFYPTQYRYHHHRFYPESKFTFYNLDMEKLKQVLHYGVLQKAPQKQQLPEFFLKKMCKKLVEPIWNIMKKNVNSRKESHFFPFSLHQMKIAIEKNAASPWHIYAYENLEQRKFTYDLLLWIKNNIPLHKAILEFGCGCGQNLFWLKKQGATSLTGIDIDNRAISAASMLNKNAVDNEIVFRCQDFFSNDIKEKFFFIFSLDMIYLQNEFNFEEVIKKCKSSLETGGYIAFDVIDTAYDTIKNNKYLTSDWSKDEEERRPSEYKLRTSYDDIAGIIFRQGFSLVLHKFYGEIPQRSLYIIKKMNE